MSEVRVLPKDLPPAGLCMTGGRRWFHEYGLDFKEFIAEGTPVSVIRATNCPLGERACQVAEARVAREAADGREE